MVRLYFLLFFFPAREQRLCDRKQESRYYVTNCFLTIMDPGGENSPRLLLGSAKFTPVDAISIKGGHPQDTIQCILEHEATGTPLVLTGLNSCTSWPSVIPPLLGRGGLAAEGWYPTRSSQGQGLTSWITGRDERNNRAIKDVSALLKELSSFSNYLLSDQTATYPLILGDLRCEVDYVGSGKGLSHQGRSCDEH